MIGSWSTVSVLVLYQSFITPIFSYIYTQPTPKVIFIVDS